MHPILFHIGDFAVHAYGGLGSLAFLVGALIVLVRGKALGIAPERMADLLFWTGILSLLGARLTYLAQNPEQIHGLVSFVDLRGGGLVFYGAFIVGLPVASLLMRWFHMPFYGVWDVLATAMPIAHGISRVGCFAAGCCYGTPTDVPWAVRFTDPLTVAPRDVLLHPTQLYEALWLFLVGAVVNVFYARKRFHGQVMLLYLSLYALGRSVVEVFRGDAERGWFLPELLGETLTFSQGVSVLVALLALTVFFVGARRAGAQAG